MKRPFSEGEVVSPAITKSTIIKTKVPTYFWRRSWSRHLFHLLIKDCLDTLAHSCNRVVHTIKFFAILDNEIEISDKLVGIIVTGIFMIGIGLLRIRACKLAFNCGKIHWSSDNIEIIGNVKCDRVDRPYERGCILEPF